MLKRFLLLCTLIFAISAPMTALASGDIDIVSEETETIEDEYDVHTMSTTMGRLADGIEEMIPNEIEEEIGATGGTDAHLDHDHEVDMSERQTVSDEELQKLIAEWAEKIEQNPELYDSVDGWTPYSEYLGERRKTTLTPEEEEAGYKLIYGYAFSPEEIEKAEAAEIFWGGVSPDLGTGTFDVQFIVPEDVYEDVYVVFTNMSDVKSYGVIASPINNYRATITLPTGYYMVVDAGPVYKTDNYFASGQTFQIFNGGNETIQVVIRDADHNEQYGAGVQLSSDGTRYYYTHDENLKEIYVNPETGEYETVGAQTLNEYGQTEAPNLNVASDVNVKDQTQTTPSVQENAPKKNEALIKAVLLIIFLILPIIGIAVYFKKRVDW